MAWHAALAAAAAPGRRRPGRGMCGVRV